MNDVALEKAKKTHIRKLVKYGAKKSWTMRLSYALTILGTAFGWFLEQFPFYREKLPEGMVLWAVPAVAVLFGLSRMRSIIRDAKDYFND